MPTTPGRTHNDQQPGVMPWFNTSNTTTCNYSTYQTLPHSTAATTKDCQPLTLHLPQYAFWSRWTTGQSTITTIQDLTTAFCNLASSQLTLTSSLPLSLSSTTGMQQTGNSSNQSSSALYSKPSPNGHTSLPQHTQLIWQIAHNSLQPQSWMQYNKVSLSSNHQPDPSGSGQRRL